MSKSTPGWKKTLRSLSAFVLILLIPVQAWAASVEPQDVGLGLSIITPSGTSVYFGGASSSAGPEDSLLVSSYLQQLQGTTWVTIDSVSKIAYNTSYVSIGRTVTVSGGNYYRTKSYHQSSTDGEILGFYSYSGSKWVS